MSPADVAVDDPGMPTYLIEIHMGDAGDRELELAVRMLTAAQARVDGSMAGARGVIAGVSRQDGRLVSLTDPPSLEAAHRLVGIALLPSARVREISRFAGAHLPGRHPGRDVDPGVEAELVEDVVDVGLDGPLRQE